MGDPRRGLGLCAAVLALLAGCSTDGEGEGGFGVPTQPAGAPVDGERIGIRGTVLVAGNGCLLLDTGDGPARWIVWPPGQEADQGQPVLDGRQVADGDGLDGTGALLPATALPDWSDPDGYWASYGGFCAAEESGVVVLDEVSRTAA